MENRADSPVTAVVAEDAAALAELEYENELAAARAADAAEDEAAAVAEAAPEETAGAAAAAAPAEPTEAPPPAISEAEGLARDVESAVEKNSGAVLSGREAEEAINNAMRHLKELRHAGASKEEIDAAVRALEVASGSGDELPDAADGSVPFDLNVYLARPKAPPPPPEDEAPQKKAPARSPAKTNFFASPIKSPLKVERPEGAPPLSADDIARGAETFAKILEKQKAESERERKKRAKEEKEEARKRAILRRKELEKEKARLKEEERIKANLAAEIARAQKGENTIKILPPPPPPADPFRFVDISQSYGSNIVPRGKIVLKIHRVTGLSGTGLAVENEKGGRTASTHKSSFFGTIMGTRGDTINRTVTNEDGTKESVPTGHIYVQFELHLGAARLEARTPTYRNVVLTDFKTLGAEVEFRFSTGLPMFTYPITASSVEKGKLPPILFYKVMKVGRLDDYMLGEGQLPAGFLFSESVTNDFFNISLPLLPKGRGEDAQNLRYQSGNINAWISAQFQFIPSRSGILTITVAEGLNLESFAIGTIKPFPRVECGKGMNARILGANVGGVAPVPELDVRGSMSVEGGMNPKFNHEELVLWIDHEHGTSDSQIKVSLCVEDMFGDIKELGSTSISVLAWTKSADVMDELLDLRAPSLFNVHDTVGDFVGQVQLQRRFYPAGLLTVKICRGIKVIAKDITGTNDAYVKVALEGRSRSYRVKTKTIPNSGPNPVFGETFVFDVVDHADMRISLWDFDVLTADDLVGEVLVDLAGVYEYGVRDAVIPLKAGNLWGGLSDAGLIHAEVDFVGSNDLAYPMLQTMRPSFKGDRRELRQKLTDEQKLARAQAAESDDLFDAAAMLASSVDKGEEWTEEDIEAAFDFLDLNKDLYISKLELRHVLVATGESVTNLEIDEMVSMCSFGNTERIAFYEFYQLLKEKDPSQPMWKPKSEDQYKHINPFAVGGIRGLDSAYDEAIGGQAARLKNLADAKAVAELARRSNERAIEMQLRQDRKKACETAIATLHIRLQELQKCYSRFKRMVALRKLDAKQDASKNEDMVTAEEFAKCLDVEADAIRPLFLTFRDKKSSSNVLSMRDVLLGLLNFAGCTRPQRIRFCFDLYETSGDGIIDFDELVMILKGASLQSDAQDKFLLKKARQIIDSVAGDGAKGLDVEQFVVASSRFPNILFPSYEDREASGALKTVVLESIDQKMIQKDQAVVNKRREEKNAKRIKGEAAMMSFVIPEASDLASTTNPT